MSRTIIPSSHVYEKGPLCKEITYSLNAVEWKSNLLGVILGSLRFGVEIHSQNSGIHSKVVV